ncbi:MAG: YraN family protein [Candidatus Babeliales bacterium]
METKKFGASAELFVGNHLAQQGYTVLAQNYRQRCGEIDIIAAKKGYLIFVEVKARKTDYFNLSELITPSKQQKIIKTARYYCARNTVFDKVIRFDVALVLDTNNGFDMTYIENAFV